MNAKANNTVDKAQELCERLYLAAKKSKTRKFHALYDKVCRMDMLENGLKRVKENRGVAGIDGVSIEDILENKETVLAEIQRDLVSNEYRPRSVKRVYIPKPDGRERPLGIPTVRDRIVQASTKQVIEPIFEADFLDCSYGFRPNRCAHDALEEIRRATNAGYTIVLDADIEGYFDSINHERLLEFVSQRISDRRILKLIRKWLESGVIDEGVHQETDVGTPQGGVISPLLANICLHEFDKYWMQQTVVRGKLIRYADDFVILFETKEEAERGLHLVKTKLEELGLKLNERKTKIVEMNEGKEGFDFLGFYIRRVKSSKYWQYYTQKWPSKKAMNSLKMKIRNVLGSRPKLLWNTEMIVKEINPILRGWMNYFRYGNSHRKFSQLDSYVQERLALWWSKKHNKSGRRWKVDFTYTKFKLCGVQILAGNVVYWSRTSRA